MTENTIRGIAVVTGIAKTAHSVNHTFTREQLNQLLALFDQHPSDKEKDYGEPGKLVLWTYKERYDAHDSETAEKVKQAFPWFDPKIDLSLIEGFDV